MRLKTKEELKVELESNRRINSNNCWIWTKCRSRSGYGQMSIQIGGHKQKLEYVHRVSAFVYKDISLEDKDDICHDDNICKSKGCFNPEHIFKGDRSINMRSAFHKRRLKS